MAVKDSNQRVIITLSKPQVEWLDTTAKKLKMTRSKLIKWLINRNISHFINSMPKAELDWLIKVAKTKWLEINDEEDER